MNQKKIVLINNGYPSDLYPNRSTYIKTIIDCLPSDLYVIDKIVLIDDFSGFFSKIARYFQFYVRLIRLKITKGDIIYIHHVPFCVLPLLFHRINKAEVVINWHGEDLTSKSFIVNVLRSIAIWKFKKVCKVHVVPSFYFKDKLKRKIGVPREKIIVIPSGGVDATMFYPFTSELKNSDLTTVGFASGLEIGKGAHILEKLIDLSSKKVDDLEFQIISYGTLLNHFKNKYKNKSNVYFSPKLNKEKMNCFYNDIDILFFPTQREAESLGLVSLEAMFCEIPVLGPNKYELPIIIKPGENGEFFFSDNTDAIYSVLLSMKTKLTSYSPRKSVVNIYSKDIVAKRYKELFGKF